MKSRFLGTLHLSLQLVKFMGHQTGLIGWVIFDLSFRCIPNDPLYICANLNQLIIPCIYKGLSIAHNSCTSLGHLTNSVVPIFALSESKIIDGFFCWLVSSTDTIHVDLSFNGWGLQIVLREPKICCRSMVWQNLINFRSVPAGITCLTLDLFL